MIFFVIVFQDSRWFHRKPFVIDDRVPFGGCYLWQSWWLFQWGFWMSRFSMNVANLVNTIVSRRSFFLSIMTSRKGRDAIVDHIHLVSDAYLRLRIVWRKRICHQHISTSCWASLTWLELCRFRVHTWRYLRLENLITPLTSTCISHRWMWSVLLWYLGIKE